MTATLSSSAIPLDASPRLAPGHLLYAGPGGQWRYASPDGEFLNIAGDPHRIDSAVRRLRGEASDDEDAYGSLVGLLRDFGALVVEPAAVSLPRTTILGDNVIARSVADSLRLPTGTLADLDEQTVADTDVLVTCAGWLPDDRWQIIDAWCSRHQTAWVRSHVEGDLISVGPTFRGAGTPSYTDYRGRRRAAAPLVEELDAFWAYLGTVVDEQLLLPVGPSLIAAGIIVTSVDRIASGEAPTRLAVETTIRVSDSRVDTHVVLPLPTGIA